MNRIGNEPDTAADFYAANWMQRFARKGVDAPESAEVRIGIPLEEVDHFRRYVGGCMLTVEGPDLGVYGKEAEDIAAKGLAKYPIDEVFPWLEKGTDGEVLISEEDLRRIALADIEHNYPDRIGE